MSEPTIDNSKMKGKQSMKKIILGVTLIMGMAVVVKADYRSEQERYRQTTIALCTPKPYSSSTAT